MTEITQDQARWLRKYLKLEVYSSFSNPYPSDLCYEYRMETGYCVPGIMSEFMRSVTTKDDCGNFVNKYYLKCEKPEDEE